MNNINTLLFWKWCWRSPAYAKIIRNIYEGIRTYYNIWTIRNCFCKYYKWCVKNEISFQKIFVNTTYIRYIYKKGCYEKIFSVNDWFYYSIILSYDENTNSMLPRTVISCHSSSNAWEILSNKNCCKWLVFSSVLHVTK